jgi:hypothetical protein
MLDDKTTNTYNIILSIFLAIAIVLTCNFIFNKQPVIVVEYPKIKK